MNSAEKKAPEPSMDDIISSIRNIIADDTQESAPTQTADPAPAPPVPVVQLTENQIAGQEMIPAPAAQMPAPVMPAPVMPEPVSPPIDPFAEAGALVASEIEAVPGTAMVTPGLDASLPQAAAQIAPDDAVSMVNPAIGAPQPGVQFQQEPLAASAEIGDQLAGAPIMPAPMESAPPVAPAARAPVAPAIEQMVGAAVLREEAMPPPPQVPLVPELGPVPIPVAAAPALAPMAEALPPSVDPVEEMMQGSDAPGDGLNDVVDPDRILEGMGDPVTEITATSFAAQNPAAPLDGETNEATPLVLDASQVTPEDAAAISAVATATSEALAGRTQPEASEGCQSLEESVKAMLKPMIREWLDDNMPRILEGAVKEEVKPSGNDDT